MNKKLQEFNIKYPNYEIVNFKNNYSTFYFYDENKILHKKDNLYRALNFKIGICSAVNKVLYIQNILNTFEEPYLIIKYGGMKSKSIIKLNNFTYEVNTYDLLHGHDVSNINCVDIIKSEVSKSRKCGFSRSKFNSLYKNKKVNLYLINIYNETESFYKIGVTYNSIQKRFKKLKYESNYDYILLNNIIVNGNLVYDLEKEIKRLGKPFNYKPLVKYSGYTESFTKEIKEIYEKFKKIHSEIIQI